MLNTVSIGIVKKLMELNSNTCHGLSLLDTTELIGINLIQLLNYEKYFCLIIIFFVKVEIILSSIRLIANKILLMNYSLDQREFDNLLTEK